MDTAGGSRDHRRTAVCIAVILWMCVCVCVGRGHDGRGGG